jgi:hypothetical protein
MRSFAAVTAFPGVVDERELDLAAVHLARATRGVAEAPPQAGEVFGSVRAEQARPGVDDPDLDRVGGRARFGLRSRLGARGESDEKDERGRRHRDHPRAYSVHLGLLLEVDVAPKPETREAELALSQ